MQKPAEDDSTKAPQKQRPKISPRVSVEDRPAAIAAVPTPMIGPKKAKLVPCKLSNPDPTGPNRLHWIKVATPETNRDMLMMYPVSPGSSPRAPLMISGGVMMPTKEASTC
jgi:hypothetical protein